MILLTEWAKENIFPLWTLKRATLTLRSGIVISIKRPSSLETAYTNSFVCLLAQLALLPLGKLMDKAFQSLKWKDVVIAYFDDICIYTTSIDEHLDVLNQSMSILENYGFKIEINKRQFVQTQIKFLGYIVSNKGKLPDPERSAAVDNYPDTLRTLQDLRRFLGFASYFRKFIKGFAEIARLLSQLLQKKTHSKQTVRIDIPSEWTSDHTEAVHKLKIHLKSPPILAHFDPDKETHVYVDASPKYLGAFITQKHECEEFVVEYASRVTSETEAKLHSNMLECIALHWTLTETFCIYAYCLHAVHVSTDNYSASLWPVHSKWTENLLAWFSTSKSFP